MLSDNIATIIILECAQIIEYRETSTTRAIIAVTNAVLWVIKITNPKIISRLAIETVHIHISRILPSCKWNVNFLYKFSEDISPFRRATDTPVLDFWRILLWVSFRSIHTMRFFFYIFFVICVKRK